MGQKQVKELSQQIPGRLLTSCSGLSLNYHKVLMLRESYRSAWVSDWKASCPHSLAIDSSLTYIPNNAGLFLPLTFKIEKAPQKFYLFARKRGAPPKMDFESCPLDLAVCV